MGLIFRIWRVGMIVVTVAAAINRFAEHKKTQRARNDRREASSHPTAATRAVPADSGLQGDSQTP